MSKPSALVIAHNIADAPLAGVGFTHVPSRSLTPEEFAAVHRPDGTPGKKAAEIAAAIRKFKEEHGCDDYTAYMALRMQQPELFSGS
jgi:hypothetical protein